MDVTALLIAVLLPPAMLAVVMAMAGYEDLILPADPADPADPAAEAKDPATAEGGGTPLP